MADTAERIAVPNVGSLDVRIAEIADRPITEILALILIREDIIAAAQIRVNEFIDKMEPMLAQAEQMAEMMGMTSGE
jgi:hypothetical protein